MAFHFIFSFFASIFFISLFPYLRSFFKSNRRQPPLPPGMVGLTSVKPSTYTPKTQTYGSIFKTHILGCPCGMISSPEAAKFVLLTTSHLFHPTFPASKERMLGREAIFFSRGQYHAKLRKLVLRAFMPNIESIAQHSLHSSEGRLYTFNVALLSIFGKDQVVYSEDLKRHYYVLEKGYNSMPIDLPEGLTDEQITDNIIGVIFAARDTTASVLAWIIKYLGENPAVLEAVTEEQEAIMRGKEGQKLSWEDTKKMPLTSRVIQETLRVASILSFTFREAVEDVEYDGYLIPKGWKALPLFRNIHHSPDIFPDPEKFDPSRVKIRGGSQANGPTQSMR
ncbi:Abscisic acid 8'-hydroxylase 1 [Hibiscus syriacus]|uniref:Abscisic acid 8'-hydroxylase 1 n=1 Tax=Hibiscus syriacus TaxID=106335 RepID=A0A6A2ZMC7_HIBSY|nr:Abscisic acid 8'-hydroxylase 1 [Hibiscus syriacus]